MSIQLHGHYQDGVIYPDRPLPLADGAEVEVAITVRRGNGESLPTPPDLDRPAAPTISSVELQSRLDQFAVSVGSLPPDFSRADIYRDRD